MIQEFDFDGIIVTYDTESLPLEYERIDGNTKIKVIRPNLTYDEKHKRLKNIRDTVARLLSENDNIKAI